VIGTRRGEAKSSRTTDGGHTWPRRHAAFQAPRAQVCSAVDFRDPLHGILGAGELAAPTAFATTVARSSDGGKSWQLTSRPPVPAQFTV